MQNVPKIVRERLKAAPALVRPSADSNAHPDADLLTAFAERSLAEFERAAVLEHLSRCGDCREVVALALPPSEETSVTGVRTSPRGWLTWPTLRWGFVAAGIVAIASVGILRHQYQPATMASKQSPRLEVAANEPKKQDLDRFVAPEPKEKEKLQAPAAPAFADSPSASNSARSDSVVSNSAVDHPVVDSKKTAPRPEVSAARVPAPEVRSGTNSFHGGALAANALPHGPRVANQANQWQQQNAYQNNAQNTTPLAPPPSAYPARAAGRAAANPQAATDSETVEVSSAAPAIVAGDDLKKLDVAQGRDQSTVDRAKDPVPSVAGAAASPAASGPAGAMVTQPYPGRSFGGPIANAGPGRMFGYVFDPSGAVVPNVRITVTPSNAKEVKTAVTDSQGAWLIAGLPSGSYKAQAEAPGFRTTVLDVNYDANQPSAFRFTLDLGSIAETVEVTGGNTQVQTERGNINGPVNGRVLTELTKLTPPAMPRWTISATGTLQRSFDEGKTWHAVDVSANAASAHASNSATNLQVTAEASSAKVSKDKSLARVAKQKAEALTFRAVSAAGSEVWAGGSGGTLYHSADAGNSWVRFVPASSGTTLTGDVISIDFADPQHGRVSTSTSEVWATADGGRSWQKQ